ncbi:MAG: DUF87 domain-containing protein, partial [Cyanothece sp. SIO1E1]|nr:DUF87 domain-containing protein [Cyanothece sp. SIO1E1]
PKSSPSCKAAHTNAGKLWACSNTLQCSCHSQLVGQCSRIDDTIMTKFFVRDEIYNLIPFLLVASPPTTLGCALPEGPSDIPIGKVRYSSSRRFQQTEIDVRVSVQAPDFAGKRTALFGMTRTGKSNTAKKIIQACVEMSAKAPLELDKDVESPEEVLKPLTEENNPKYPIGQIIFDINGEYANPNLQDQGTAIFDLYQDKTVRYSTVPKEGFREMKVNFYADIQTGFELIRSYPTVVADNTRFASNFKSIELDPPANYESDKFSSAAQRYERRVAAYLCCLYRAGFSPPSNQRICFTTNATIRDAVNEISGISVEPKEADKRKGILDLSLEQASNWWDNFWKVYTPTLGKKQKKSSNTATKGSDDNQADQKEWADDDLKALLVMLTRRREPGQTSLLCNGYRILSSIKEQHTSTVQEPFEDDILKNLRKGKIVIVDLSLGDPNIQALFSERICRTVFSDATYRFTSTLPNNFIQFYFEEAHNLFPKKDDKDLSQIYNRLAKEGAKFNLGLIYATQEVSSISSNILKATQNWFISHLNNEDEIRELRKYYDFSDFTESLIRFSQNTDKGFVRMKTYSNPFVIPVQIDRFPPENLVAS